MQMRRSRRTRRRRMKTRGMTTEQGTGWGNWGEDQKQITRKGRNLKKVDGQGKKDEDKMDRKKGLKNRNGQKWICWHIRKSERLIRRKNRGKWRRTGQKDLGEGRECVGGGRGGFEEETGSFSTGKTFWILKSRTSAFEFPSLPYLLPFFCIPSRDSNRTIGVVFAIAHVVARTIAEPLRSILYMCSRFVSSTTTMPSQGPFITKFMTDIVTKIALCNIFIFWHFEAKMFLICLLESSFLSPMWNTKQQQTARRTEKHPQTPPAQKQNKLGEGWGLVRWTCTTVSTKKPRKWFKRSLFQK